MLNILGIINGIVQGIASQIGSSISAVIGGIESNVQRYVINPVASEVSSTLGQIGDSVNYLETQASVGINNTLNTVGNTLASMESSTVSGFERGLSAVEQAIATTASATTQELDRFVAAVEQGFTAVGNGVSHEIAVVLSGISDQLDAASVRVADALDPIFLGISKFLDQLPSDITTIAHGIKDAIGDLTDATMKVAEGGITDIEKTLKWLETDPALGAIEKKIAESIQGFPDALETSFGKIAGVDVRYLDPVTLPQIASTASILDLVTIWTDALPQAWFYMGNLLDKFTSAAQIGAFRNLQQAGNAGSRNELLSPGQLIEGKYKGVIDDNEYIDSMRRHGYTDDRASQLYDIANSPLSLGDIIALARRGIIKDTAQLQRMALAVRADPEQLEYAMRLSDDLLPLSELLTLWRRGLGIKGQADVFDDARSGGLSEDRIEAVKAASYSLPSIYDQQEFIRRNVDDEQFVAKYGLDYGIDDKYFDLAKAHGYDRKTALQLYRRYWSIPPFFITEGLYRTGKMSAETFKQLLISEGYTPQWSDIFIDQLKPRLTLADIKDEYKYQVITADEIVGKVVSIGYEQDLAEQYKELWIASVKLAAPIDQTDSQATAGKVKGDTESLISTAYKDHVLSRSDALAALKSINYTDEAANLILEIADYNLTQQDIKDAYALVQDQYLAGQISETDAMQALITAGASHDQVVQYQAKLQKAGRTKPKTPSLSEFGAWFKKGIISAEQLSAGISLLGYSDTWVPFYLLYFGVDPKAIATMGFTLSVPVV